MATGNSSDRANNASLLLYDLTEAATEIIRARRALDLGVDVTPMYDGTELAPDLIEALAGASRCLRAAQLALDSVARAVAVRGEQTYVRTAHS
jgi:hypothetical protein